MNLQGLPNFLIFWSTWPIFLSIFSNSNCANELVIIKPICCIKIIRSWTEKYAIQCFSTKKCKLKGQLWIGWIPGFFEVLTSVSESRIWLAQIVELQKSFLIFEPISWEQNIRNQLFNFCVGVGVGGHDQRWPNRTPAGVDFFASAKKPE